MDWEVISEQALRHVQELLPSQAQRDSTVSVGKPTPPLESSSGTEQQSMNGAEGAASSTPGSSTWKQPCRVDASRITQAQGTSTVAPAAKILHRTVGHRVLPEIEGARTGVGSHPPDSNDWERLNAMVDILQQQQALVNHALHAHKDEVGRGLAEVRLVLQRIQVLEQRVMTHDNHMKNLGLLTSTREGQMTAQQRRQEQLDATVHDLGEALATLDRRSMSTEMATHGAVSHGQMIDAIRSAMGQFRGQVEERLAYLEHESSSLNDPLKQTSDKRVALEISSMVERALAAETGRSDARANQLKEWVEGVLNAEGRRQNDNVGALKEQVENMVEKMCTLSAGGKENEAKLTRAEEMYAFEIRRNLRRIEEIERELGQEREARLRDKREVLQDVSNIRASFLTGDQSHKSINNRLACLEGIMTTTADNRLQPKKGNACIGTKLEDLWLQIQVIRDATRHIVRRLSSVRTDRGAVSLDDVLDTVNIASSDALDKRHLLLQSTRREPLPTPSRASTGKLAADAGNAMDGRGGSGGVAMQREVGSRASTLETAPAALLPRGNPTVGLAVDAAADAAADVAVDAEEAPGGKATSGQGRRDPSMGQATTHAEETDDVKNSGDTNRRHRVIEYVVGDSIDYSVDDGVNDALDDVIDPVVHDDVDDAVHAVVDGEPAPARVEGESTLRAESQLTCKSVSNLKVGLSTTSSLRRQVALNSTKRRPLAQGDSEHNSIDPEPPLQLQGRGDESPSGVSLTRAEISSSPSPPKSSSPLPRFTGIAGNSQRLGEQRRAPGIRYIAPSASPSSSSSLSASLASSSGLSCVPLAPCRSGSGNAGVLVEISEGCEASEGSSAPQLSRTAIPPSAIPAIAAAAGAIVGVSSESSSASTYDGDASDSVSVDTQAATPGGHNEGKAPVQMISSSSDDDVVVKAAVGTAAGLFDSDVSSDAYVVHAATDPPLGEGTQRRDGESESVVLSKKSSSTEILKTSGTSPVLPSTSEEPRSDNRSGRTNNASNAINNINCSVDGKRGDNATNNEAVEVGRGFRNERDPSPRPPPQLQTSPSAENIGNQEVAGNASPAPVSSRERSASKDSGVATAQCEFCLRRYLRSAMTRHLQACELRLIRCPYQCGVKILVRNLEKHKKVCSLRRFSDAGGDTGLNTKLPPTPAETETEAETAPLRVGVTQDDNAAAADDDDDDDDDDDGDGDDAPGMAAVNRKPPSNGPPPPPPPPQPQPQPLRRRETRNEGRPCSGGVEAGPVSVSGSAPSGDKERMVTCMRCHESLPFHLVPSHGPKCKASSRSDPSLGTTTTATAPVLPPHKLASRYQSPSVNAVAGGPPTAAAAAAAAAATAAATAAGAAAAGLNAPPPAGSRTTTGVGQTRTTPGVGQTRTTSTTGGVGQAVRTTVGVGQPEIPPTASQGISSVGKTPTPMPAPRYVGASRGIPLRSPGSLPPAYVGLKGWHPEPGPGRERGPLAPSIGVPRSPPRSKAVRFWGTRQVASWLREVMRPPRADIISRFHDGGIDGAALLELTDRDLLHPTDGMGITDADMRRQILEAVDALEQ